jgi:hypothetical protein
MKRTFPWSTEIHFKGTWDIGLLQRISAARRQNNFLSRKVNTEDDNGGFHVMTPISADSSEAFRVRGNASCSKRLEFVRAGDRVTIIQSILYEYAAGIGIP